jgi:hypothetical protein
MRFLPYLAQGLLTCFLVLLLLLLEAKMRGKLYERALHITDDCALRLPVACYCSYSCIGLEYIRW